MGHRDPRIGRDRRRARHPGHDLKGDPLPDEQFQLFPASSEHKGISPFQPEDLFSFFWFQDKDPVDLLLGDRVIARVLAHIDHFSVLRAAA